ncbi:P-loop containing nucleoside triphosphate hydrolase protein [Pseudoneurospora amorphoporcata]|uniref:P-loop containing nucleoside triphosphate hydrolase protein n=1 Tax=Pseudoneurospora amorphoporcata TaxID=241081 RepID=A0AAN6SFI1_9PEZI|nr:P-loop containing nucleoside triphosphate hydrolase protein [Pseudoneurospora amorphoporcata]
MLGSVKTIKMLGLQGVVEKHILGLREEELNKEKRVRWIMSMHNASANALGMFAPVITIILFAIITMANDTTLDTKTAFPTIAVLALVTHPANMVMTIILQAIAAYASFEKIEDYIKSQKAPAISRSPRPAQLAEGTEVSMQNLIVKWTPEQGNPTLEDVNLELSRGKVIACLGPVGAGKSTLARAILGEVPLAKGTIRYRTESIAYCSQVPWLPNRTIKQVICGSLARYDVGNEWYRAVLKACCLDEDLAAVPDGDETVVGVDGMSLSGGQRQRVALARAVFHRCKMVVLDDPFSALVSASYTNNGPLVFQDFNLEVAAGQLKIRIYVKLLCISSGKRLLSQSRRIHSTYPTHLCALTLTRRVHALISVLQMLGLWSHLSSSPSNSCPGSEHPVIDETSPLLANTNITTTPSPNSPHHPVLDTPLSHLPTPSTSHLQLLSLCRAIIKARAAQAAADEECRDTRDMAGGPDLISYSSLAPNFCHLDIVQPIILLVDITASLDEKTEQKVLEMIKDEFVDNKYTF